MLRLVSIQGSKGTVSFMQSQIALLYGSWTFDYSVKFFQFVRTSNLWGPNFQGAPQWANLKMDLKFQSFALQCSAKQAGFGVCAGSRECKPPTWRTHLQSHCGNRTWQAPSAPIQSDLLLWRGQHCQPKPCACKLYTAQKPLAGDEWGAL